MIQRDNINVYLPLARANEEHKLRKAMRLWLKENNVKYSDIVLPGGHHYDPDAFNMRKIDAVVFKLRFGL